MPPAIHQLTAGAMHGDAITNYALEIQSLFQEAGLSSLIFTPDNTISPELPENTVYPLTSFKNMSRTGDILLYHYSIGSEATVFYQTPGYRRSLCYHNITPARYFDFCSRDHAATLRKGRKELQSLAKSTELVITDSQFNRKELLELQFKCPEVVSLIVTDPYLKTKPEPNTLHQFIDGYGHSLC